MPPTPSPDAGPHVLLIAPSGSYRVGDFLEAAGALGCRATVVTDAPPAIPGASITIALDEPATAADRILACVEEGMTAVVGTDGTAVGVAAEVAHRLGLRAPSPAAVGVAGDKHRQRIACREAGVPQPTFALIESSRSGEGWARFPAVVKPLDRTASQGVVRVDDRGELVAAVGRVRDLVGDDGPLLVEALVPGQEVALEGLLRDGQLTVLRLFDKPDTPTGPTFPETLLVSPARLAATVRDRVVEVVADAAEAMGLRNGPVHAEGLVDGDEVWFLELAARTIGGLCSRALDHGGVGHEELVLRHALGLPLPVLPEPVPMGILMLPVPRRGRVRAWRGLDRARAVDGVTDVIPSIAVGEEVLPLPGGDRYLGFVFAQGPTADAVEATLRRAWACIDVEITPA